MSTVVRFSPELARWIGAELDRGRPPAELLATMAAERMDPRVANAIVSAFLEARRGARPLPTDSLVVDDALLEDSAPPRLPLGPRVHAFDRTIDVLARRTRPTLALLAGILNGDEARELIALARPRLRPSTVVDPKTGRDRVEPHRTSLGMFFRLGENDFVARLDRRVSALMHRPVENGEGFQVLYYPTGALNAPHFDFLVPSNEANRASIARSGQRVSTLLVYLNDVEAGGETLFPKLDWAVVPKLGHGTYFEYTNARGELDDASLHAGNPVLAGEKWVLTKWMRERRFVAAGEAGAEGVSYR
ncbi:MAG TPA: 2OG-Fe(II) oxygenase [Polyangiaceae bacterium]|nr:2OG-Fe(II) oxygenase [Polyangiaceae bacterium]